MLLAALTLAACSRTPSPPPAAARELNIYGWSDYFPEDLLSDFERETGIKVRVALFPSQVVIAQRRAAEAGSHDEFRFVIPREGADSWIDALAIPADAPHVAEAHAFINFLMRPDIAARGTNFLGEATANLAALSHIDRRLRDDTGIYPPPGVRAKLVPIHSRPDAANRIVTRIWTQFRTNH